MKKNVNVFIAVLLVAVLCGGVIWLQTADEEKLGWNIHDSYGDTPSYSDGAAYTNATFAGPSAAEGGVMPLSSSSALRARTSYSYAGAYGGATPSPIAYSQSPIANSLTASSPAGGGLYTTSSQTFNSYGGGGNGGAAMSYSQSPIANRQSNSGLSTPSLQGGAGVGSISPIAYSTARRGDMSSAAGDNPAMMAAENPMVAMASAANAATAGMNTSFYGGMYATADYSSADYGQYSGMFGGSSRMGVRGKQNANPWDSWLSWLYENENGAWGTATGSDGEGLIYTYTREQLEAAYNVWKETYGQSWGPNPPSFEVWWEWMLAGGYDGYTYGGNTYRWVPVGDILPLLLIALLYLLFVAIKSKSLKLLLKTERSE